MHLQFEHETLGQRVLFGHGRAADHIRSEVARIGAERIMLIASKSQVTAAKEATSLVDVRIFHDDVQQHVPLEAAAKAREIARAEDIDLVISVGGGSSVGLAKAIALTTHLPIIAVPTTYAGSEATNVWGITENAHKTTGTDNMVLPATVVYDTAYTSSMPSDLAVASGLNALAHCIDSMWSPRSNPINRALALEGIRALIAGLSKITADPLDLLGRENALYGAYLSAVAFASAGSGLHHKICHVLGGTYNLPHAQTHAVILPHVLALNLSGISRELAARLSDAFGAETPVAGLAALYKRLGAPNNLQEFGFDELHIAEAASLILPVVPASNPVKVRKDNLEALLAAARTGQEPVITSVGPSGQAKVI